MLLPLLHEMIHRNASDLHITAGSFPMLRVDGSIVGATAGTVLSAQEVHAVTNELLTTRQKERFEAEDELDFSFEIDDRLRFRGNAYRQRGSIALAIRRIPVRIASLDELGVSPVLARLAEGTRGLVLVTGPTGSGKSTTVAGILDRINRERHGHILTIEDPIEFVHASRGCLVTQREVGTDTKSFATALKQALRQDPDVAFVGEMRDLETVQAALTIAETGHLCLATIHTGSAVESINRVVDFFPSHQQAQVRGQLAFVLEGVVTQTLLPRANGPGRVVASEVLVCTPAVRACIRDDKIHQIYTIIQTGKQHGMQTLSDSLHKLYSRREVAISDCLKWCPDVAEFKMLVAEAQ